LYINVANITVNSFYQVEAKTFVTCSDPMCSDILDTLAITSPGQDLWYKFEITNKGNVPISNINFYNNRPDVNVSPSDCSSTLRQGDVQLEYGSPTDFEACNFTSYTDTYSNTICPASYTAAYGPLSLSSSFLTPETLLPGNSFAIIVKYTVPAGATIGDFAENDFAFTAERDDIAGTTDALLSNKATVLISPNACGELNDPSEIDCGFVGLELQSISIPGGPDCCFEVSVNGNYYPDILNGISISVPGGELINYTDVDPSFQSNIDPSGQSLFITPNAEDHLPLGSYFVANICVDPLFSDVQSITAAVELDEINMMPAQLACQESLNLNCAAGASPPYWTKTYNNAEDNFGRVIKTVGNFLYVLGFKNSSFPRFPTLSKFDLNGNLVWHKEYHTDLNSIFFDFELSADQTRIVAIGCTYPYTTSNKMMISVIDASNGLLIETKEYDNVDRELLRKIIRHPNPVDSDFPFYALGQYDGASDRPILINLDKNGVVNWTSIMYINEIDDDQWAQALFPLDNGNIIIGGDDISTDIGGIVLTIDGGDGSIINAKNPSVEDWNFATEGFDFGSGFAFAGRQHATNDGFVALFDYDLNYIDAIIFPDLFQFNSLKQTSTGEIIAFANANEGPAKPVIVRMDIDFSGGSPDLVYLDAHVLEEMGANYNSTYLDISNSDDFYFVTSILDDADDWSIYMGVLPTDLNSNCIQDSSEVTLTYPLDMVDIVITQEMYTLPTPMIYTSSADLDYTCIDVCAPGCFADFDYTATVSTTDCGMDVSFTNMSTSTAGPYDWDFGDGTTVSNVDNPTHLFEAPGSYYVCLYDTECDDYSCQIITIDFDNNLPDIICNFPTPVCNDPGLCTAEVDVPNLSFMGGNLLCSNKVKTERSDGLSISAPFPIGTTYITNSYDNDFGQADTCIQIITVLDCEAPEVICPSSFEVSTDSYAGAVATWSTPEVTEQCSNLITIFPDQFSGDFFPCGTTMVTYEVSDGTNVNSCTFNVTIDCPTCDNTAMHFDGVNDNINMLNTTATSDLTLAAWILPDDSSNGGSADIIYSFGPDNRLEVGIQEGNGDVYVYDENFGDTFTSSAVDLRDGCWHHVLIEINNNVRELYVDFNLVLTWATPMVNYGPDFYIGSSANGTTTNSEFAGIIDEIRGYDVAFLAADLENIFTTIPAPASPNLRIYFPLEDGIPLHDNTGIGITMNEGDLDDGVLSGFKLLGSTSNYVCEDIDLTFACEADECENDVVAPTCAAQDLTINIDESSFVNINALMVDAGSTDNCGIVLSSLSQSSFDCADLGTNVATLTVYDAADNSSQCAFNVTVIDEIAPTCNVDDIVVSLDNFGVACIDSSMFEPVCTVTASCVKLIVAVQPIDTNLDGIIDDYAAIVEAYQLDNGSSASCGSELSFSFSADVNDNIAFFNCSSLGVNPVDLWVTDEFGNQAICGGAVMLQDPDDFCGASFTEEDEEEQRRRFDEFDKRVMTSSMAYTDNCGIASVSLSQDKFFCNDIGEHIVELIISDYSGNTSVCSATVEIEDKTDPVVQTQDVTIELDTSGNYFLSPLQVQLNADDNCGIDLYELSKSSFDCNDVGFHVVILTVTDFSGNTSTSSANVTVIDRYGVCCPDHLYVSDNPIDCGIYYAKDSISSDGYVESPEFVTFDAPFITLDSSFETEVGSTFETKLDGCEELPFDGDGNVYGTITIGNQVWMTQNLKTTKYNDGTDIPYLPDNIDWVAAGDNGDPAFSWYDSDDNNMNPFGALYNWFALSSTDNGGKNVCPLGWHIPTQADYVELVQFYDPASTNGSSVSAGQTLKTVGTLEQFTGLWQSPSAGNNFSKFSIMPSGGRVSNTGIYNGIYLDTNLWTITDDGLNKLVLRLIYNNNTTTIFGLNPGVGACVRCLKD